MPQLTDFQRQVIVLFKSEHPTWGLGKCSEILPNFFGAITKNQFTLVVKRIKEQDDAAHCKQGTGTATKFDGNARAAVLDLAVTPAGSPERGHCSQRMISRELNMSLGTVNDILKKSALKCYRRIKCNKLTDAHKEKRLQKSIAMIDKFNPGDLWKTVWFFDEASFMLNAPLNSQNERIYRAVNVKTDIDDSDILAEIDSQQKSIVCYAAVSWFGKSNLYFIEGYAAGQDNVPNSKKKKKTVNQEIYREEMCPHVFEDINRIMQNEPWTWQQDGAKPHTAVATINWLRENTPDFIEPSEWPSKSPDLNVMDYCMWSILLSHLQQKRGQITDIEMLKDVLTQAWNEIPETTIQSATSAWMQRLRRCAEVRGAHFEHY